MLAGLHTQSASVFCFFAGAAAADAKAVALSSFQSCAARCSFFLLSSCSITFFTGSSLSSAALHLATPQQGACKKCSLMRVAPP
eukprot:281108-Pelagomonas_calceolata.AAC.6